MFERRMKLAVCPGVQLEIYYDNACEDPVDEHAWQFKTTDSSTPTAIQISRILSEYFEDRDPLGSEIAKELGLTEQFNRKFNKIMQEYNDR